MDRRTFCKTAVAGVAGTALTGALTGTAAATGHDGEVSTRGHFEIGWWNDVDLTEGHTETDYEVADPVPGFGEADSPEEVVVFAHGWLTDEIEADETFELVADSLAANGYDGPVVGYDWDANEVAWIDDWYPSEEIARRNGPKLASFLVDYREENPGTTIRLGAHSLGAQLAFATVETLADWDRTDLLDAAFLLGGAAEEDAVDDYGEFREPVARAVGEFDNYYSFDDTTLINGFASVEWEYPIGGVGAEGDVPANFEDHDVSDVEEHLDYFKQDVGCMGRVVENWT